MVPLRQHPLVALQRSEVAAARLAEHHVEIAAANRRRAVDHLHVVGRKEHRPQQSDQLRNAAGNPVNADQLPDPGACGEARFQLQP